MELRSYDFDPQLARRFVALRADLNPSAYATDKGALQLRFDRSFAFYGKPGNRHRHFAALAHGRLVGHVSAFVNAELADADGAPVGAIGLFECMEDEAVARVLVHAALDWLADVGRGQLIWAPVDFDIWHGYRFRTRGFGPSLGFRGEPDNQGWYPAVFERCGFEVRERWASVEIAGAPALRALSPGGESRLRECLLKGYRIDPMDAETDFAAAYELVLDSFAGFLGFTRPTFAEFRETWGPLWHGADLRLATLVRDPTGAPVGFALAYPEGDRVVFFIVGITQAEVANRHGLGRAAFWHCLQRIVAAGHQRVVFALMSQGSGARSLVGPRVGDAQTEHALYCRDRR